MADQNYNEQDRQIPQDAYPNQNEPVSGEFDGLSSYSNGPEPPIRWNGNSSEAIDAQPVEASSASQDGLLGSSSAMVAIGKTRFKVNGDEVQAFKDARFYITASQVIAVVSLFFGGALLSAVAVACGLFAYGKLARLAATRDSEPEVQAAIRRSGKIVIAVGALALVLNLLSVIFLYPIVAQNLQAGDLGALATSTGLSGVVTGGNSTWG